MTPPSCPGSVRARTFEPVRSNVSGISSGTTAALWHEREGLSSVRLPEFPPRRASGPSTRTLGNLRRISQYRRSFTRVYQPRHLVRARRGVRLSKRGVIGCWGWPFRGIVLAANHADHAALFQLRCVVPASGRRMGLIARSGLGLSRRQFGRTSAAPSPEMNQHPEQRNEPKRADRCRRRRRNVLRAGGKETWSDAKRRRWRRCERQATGVQTARYFRDVGTKSREVSKGRSRDERRPSKAFSGLKMKSPGSANAEAF